MLRKMIFVHSTYTRNCKWTRIKMNKKYVQRKSIYSVSKHLNIYIYSILWTKIIIFIINKVFIMLPYNDNTKLK